MNGKALAFLIALFVLTVYTFFIEPNRSFKCNWAAFTHPPLLYEGYSC